MVSLLSNCSMELIEFRMVTYIQFAHSLVSFSGRQYMNGTTSEHFTFYYLFAYFFTWLVNVLCSYCLDWFCQLHSLLMYWFFPYVATLTSSCCLLKSKRRIHFRCIDHGIHLRRVGEIVEPVGISEGPSFSTVALSRIHPTISFS